jgi:hypothetical protein
MGKRVRLEKHLYRDEHRDKHGQWSTPHYGIFTDWQRTHHADPLGNDLQIARDRLGELLTLNGRRFDFKAEKQKKLDEAKKTVEAEKKGLTLGEFASHYFSVLAPSLDKRQRSLDREEEVWAKLQDHFGAMPLPEIKLTATAAYRSSAKSPSAS